MKKKERIQELEMINKDLISNMNAMKFQNYRYAEELKNLMEIHTDLKKRYDMIHPELDRMRKLIANQEEFFVKFDEANRLWEDRDVWVPSREKNVITLTKVKLSSLIPSIFRKQ